MPVELKRPLNMNWLWAEILVEELWRQGVGIFCLAPGSRSAPLLSAAGRHPGIESIVHFDERALAFYACGLASSARRPVALVCTSGTAAANFLPAVIEASKKKLPLIVITADRPPELQKTGAHQTIEQERLYQDYVRWMATIPCSTHDIPATFLLTTAAQALSRARGEVPGPVHLNMMFRDPLGPVAGGKGLARYASPLKNWLASGRSYTYFAARGAVLSTEDRCEACVRLGRIRRGVILAGKLSAPADGQAVLEFARKTGFPVFPDITSGLRLGSALPEVVAYHDSLLGNHKPDFDGIIHFGGRMTSKRCYQLIERMPPGEYIMVLPHPLRSDPLHRVTFRAAVTPQCFIANILPLLPQRPVSSSLTELKKAEVPLIRLLDKRVLAGELSGPSIARVVSACIPQGSGLFLSNSLPLRDMDTFAVANGAEVVVGANRGASGIDGIIASAAGFAKGLGKPVTLMIGDLAFFYDLNALAFLKDKKICLVIVLVNNDGGGIFSRLSVAQDKAVFEKCFATPHGLQARAAAALFGIPYDRPVSLAAFKKAYQRAIAAGRSGIIELTVARDSSSKGY